MQDIMSKINLLKRKFKAVESELDYLFLEGDEDAIQGELDFIQKALDKASMVNCTPHPITIEGIGELPPSGILPRVTSVYCDTIGSGGVIVRQKVLGQDAVIGLPDPVEGVTFIVAGEVRRRMDDLPAHLSRPDVFVPDTGDDAVRNEQGHIVAVRGLVQ